MSRKIGGKTYLTSGEVAKLLGVSLRTVQRWKEKAVLSESDETQVQKGVISFGSKKAQLSFFIDPFNGRHYFLEDKVKEFVSLFTDA